MKLIPKRTIRFGNKKLPSTTGIFNLCAAHDCPSAKRGMCQVVNAGHRCYAKRDEVTYPGPLNYRRRQEKTWDSMTAAEFADEFMTLVRRRRGPTDALRLNESGDFRDQADVRKASMIANLLRREGIKVYCYTARRDLDFSHTGGMVVNGSGFKVHGEFRFVRTRAEKPKGYGVCPGSCKACKRCQLGKLTIVLPH